MIKLKKMKTFKIKKVLMAVSLFAIIIGLVGPINVFAASPAPVNLLSAGDFSILAKTAITTTGVTSIIGNIGVSPAAASYITGFGLTMDATNQFSKSSLITGGVFASDYGVPTPTRMTTAISNMETAYTNAAGRTNPDATELGTGNIGGLTIFGGLYKWSTNVIIPTNVTLSGSANDVWIFQIAGDLNIASAGDISNGIKVLLTGGAKAENIFWQVGGVTGATLGTYSTFNGNILSAKQIVIRTGAVLNGKALSQTQVTLDANTITSALITIQPTPVVRHISSGSSPMPINNNPSTSSVSNNSEEGCSVGNMFNTANGNPCKNNSIIEEGCSAGNLFNIVNGHACNNNAKNTITNYDFGIKTLKVGSKGEAVKILQALVGATVDGFFGSMTKAKVMIWQTNNGLTADGLFGNMSKAKFNLQVK